MRYLATILLLGSLLSSCTDSARQELNATEPENTTELVVIQGTLIAVDYGPETWHLSWTFIDKETGMLDQFSTSYPNPDAADKDRCLRRYSAPNGFPRPYEQFQLVQLDCGYRADRLVEEETECECTCPETPETPSVDRRSQE